MFGVSEKVDFCLTLEWFRKSQLIMRNVEQDWLSVKTIVITRYNYTSLEMQYRRRALNAMPRFMKWTSQTIKLSETQNRTRGNHLLWQNSDSEKRKKVSRFFHLRECREKESPRKVQFRVISCRQNETFPLGILNSSPSSSSQKNSLLSWAVACMRRIEAWWQKWRSQGEECIKVCCL